MKATLRYTWTPEGFEVSDVVHLQWRDLRRAMAASSLPGRAFHVACALALQSRMQRSNVVSLQPDLLRRFDIGARALRNGLRALEHAGLVVVQRHSGRRPRIALQGASRVHIRGGSHA